MRFVPATGVTVLGKKSPRPSLGASQVNGNHPVLVIARNLGLS
jgi:hypothetical protein